VSEKQGFYEVKNQTIDFYKSRQSYPVNEIRSVFLKMEPLEKSIKSPLLKILFKTKEMILDADDDLVYVYLDVQFENGKKELLKLHNHSVRNTSVTYYQIIRNGIEMKRDLESLIRTS
jgi:hypothetical protein